MGPFISTHPYYQYSCEQQLVWQTSEAMFLIDLACVLNDVEEHYAVIEEEEEEISVIQLGNPASSG
jgi:hypothetical protein